MTILPLRLPTFQITEQSSGQLTGLITGEDQVTPLPGSILNVLRLTLYVIKSNGADEIVNGRNQQNVLNLNGVQVLETPLTSALGRLYNFIWTVQPADTMIVESFLLFERHIALLEWGWPTGKQGKKELILNVQNLRRVS